MNAKTIRNVKAAYTNKGLTLHSIIATTSQPTLRSEVARCDGASFASVRESV